MTQVVIVVPSDDVDYVRACARYLCAGVAHVTSVTRCGRFWFGEGVKLDAGAEVKSRGVVCGSYECG